MCLQRFRPVQGRSHHIAYEMQQGEAFGRVWNRKERVSATLDRYSAVGR
jgi:hypothetical protein